MKPELFRKQPYLLPGCDTYGSLKMPPICGKLDCKATCLCFLLFQRTTFLTDMPLISPVILCGGSGTRLWPLSRKSYPKQFARLMGTESLFQASVHRLSGRSLRRPW